MRYEAPKRQRVFHTFIGMTNFDDYWWDGKEWVLAPNHANNYSSHCNCNSLRAFRRRLKKAPKGVEFILVSRWKGYDIYGKNTAK